MVLLGTGVGVAVVVMVKDLVVVGVDVGVMVPCAIAMTDGFDLELFCAIDACCCVCEKGNPLTCFFCVVSSWSFEGRSRSGDRSLVFFCARCFGGMSACKVFPLPNEFSESENYEHSSLPARQNYGDVGDASKLFKVDPPSNSNIECYLGPTMSCPSEITMTHWYLGSTNHFNGWKQLLTSVHLEICLPFDGRARLFQVSKSKSLDR
jgi:hypothetical protein